MITVGIICEYNPFHNGHAAQIAQIRRTFGPDCAVICLMSGNYVQRGEPAVFDKITRAKAAVLCGADLVLELPLTVCLRSAEGFASGGVKLLTALGCEVLCFGSETGDLDAFRRTAELELTETRFLPLLEQKLKDGCSYPAAREAALRELGAGACVQTPNDILAVEYCKAILAQGSPIRPFTIKRCGAYHDNVIDPESPSATSVRLSLKEKAQWEPAVPEVLHALYREADIHTFEAGERAILARVRTLPAAAFRAADSGKEGAWSRLYKACRTGGTTEEILALAKTKRYTRTRLQRMLMLAFLGLSCERTETTPPYLRLLAFDDRGREVLRLWKERYPILNAGQRPETGEYYALESLASDLYCLFSGQSPAPCGEEDRIRVFSAGQAGALENR